jgi:hypothetical protein
MSTTATKEMTPEQAKEQLDEVLELQAEEKELRDKMEKAHARHKEAKEAHDAKEAEIIRHLEGLNQELPLFDTAPEDVPWPFPLSGDVLEATLADVAADPLVVGLSITVVKAVREKLSATNLRGLQKALGGETRMGVDAMTKAKRDLSRKLGPAQALNVLRGVASFTAGRNGKTAAAPAKKAETNGKPAEAGGGSDKLKVYGGDMKLHRGMPLQQLVGLHGFTQDMADKLKTVAEITTVDGLLSKVEDLKRGKKADSSPEYLEARLGTHVGMAKEMAKRMLDALWKIDEAIELAAQGEPAKGKAVSA